MQEPWIMDLDSTVVTVYGKQEGAAVGYNPSKPGRPILPLPYLHDGPATSTD